jgi:hypothetical protein
LENTDIVFVLSNNESQRVYVDRRSIDQYNSGDPDLNCDAIGFSTLSDSWVIGRVYDGNK